MTKPTFLKFATDKATIVKSCYWQSHHYWNVLVKKTPLVKVASDKATIVKKVASDKATIAKKFASDKATIVKICQWKSHRC